MNNSLLKSMNIIQSYNGNLFYNNQRVVMTPSSGIGTLRKNLLETIGPERAKTFLIRYGWNLGVSDAALMVKKMKWASLEEIILEGPKQHMLMGHAKVEATTLNMNPEMNQFHIEGTWHHSYEAYEHLNLFGISKEAVCHILVGYASGYTSEVLGTTVIYKEKACEGMGHSCCHFIGKTINDWDGQVDNEICFFEEKSLIHELENAYEQIVFERDNLNKTIDFHKKLMELVMLGKDLQSIAKMVYEFLHVPIIITKQKLQPIATVGIEESEFVDLQAELILKMKLTAYHEGNWGIGKKQDQNSQMVTTKLLLWDDHQHCLVTPVIVRQKLVGYCILVLKFQEVKEIYRMILERTAAASSVYLLNQQIAIETEQRSRGYFLEQILSRQLSKEEILKWGQHLGLNLEKSFYVAVLNQMKIPQTITKKEQLECNEQLIGSLSTFFTTNGLRYLIGQRLNHIVILIPENHVQQHCGDVLELFKRILNHCHSLYRRKKFKIGISSCSDSIDTAVNQYEEAQAAFQMANTLRQIISFDELGAVGILIQTANESVIKKYIDNLIGKLLAYDLKKGTEAVKTLYVYLTNGGNLEITASEMALSISGLRYRLQKIVSLLDADIKNPHINYQLYLAIQLLIVFGEVDIEI